MSFDKSAVGKHKEILTGCPDPIPAHGRRCVRGKMKAMNASFSEVYRRVNEDNNRDKPATDVGHAPAAKTKNRPARPRMALVVVDAQNDFSEGGALAVDGAVAAYTATYLHVSGTANKYAVLATTRDTHVDPGAHFSDSPDFVDSWPRHCVAGTSGAEFHPGIQRALDLFEQLNPNAVRIDVTKGEHDAAYSGFEGTTQAGVALADALRACDIEEIDVVGVATDHCVRATVLDGLKEGFSVRVLSKQVAAVDAKRGEEALAEMATAGATVV